MLVDPDMRAMLSEFLRHGVWMDTIHILPFALLVLEQVSRYGISMTGLVQIIPMQRLFY